MADNESLSVGNQSKEFISAKDYNLSLFLDRISWLFLLRTFFNNLGLIWVVYLGEWEYLCQVQFFLFEGLVQDRFDNQSRMVTILMFLDSITSSYKSKTWTSLFNTLKGKRLAVYWIPEIADSNPPAACPETGSALQKERSLPQRS